MVAPAWRFWRRRPGQLLWLSATLGLGVGGVVAALAIADALWLRPLPIDDPDRVVAVAPYIDQSPLSIDGATFDVWRERAEPFEAVAVYGFEFSTEIRTAEATERARVAAVGPNLFDMLRARPHLGRLLQAHDETTDAAVLSYDAWRRLFNADPAVIGQTVTLWLMGERPDPVTVVGVAPRGFDVLSVDFPVDVYRVAAADRADRGWSTWHVLARLRPGVSLESAERVFAAATAGTVNARYTVRLKALHEHLFGDSRPLAYGVLVVAFLLLLVSATNALSMGAALSVERRSERAVRLAVGASRMGLLGQALVEAAVPTVMALAPAFLVARLSVLAFISAAPIGSWLVPTELLRLRTASLGAFELSAGVALAVVLGAVLTLTMAGVATTTTATWNRTSTMTRRDVRVRQGLIAGQVAALLALLVAAGLTTSGLTRLINQPLGFEPRGVFHFEVTRARGATADEKAAQVDRLYAAAMSVPGVRHVAASWAAPLSPVDHRVIRIDTDSGVREFLYSVPVSAGYFRTLGVSIVAGRDFVPADRGQSAAIVNRRLAVERFGSVGSAVGGVVDYGAGLSVRVVGVVEDTRQFRLAEPMGPAFYPLYEPDRDTALGVTIVVKADPRAQAAVLEQLRSVDTTKSIVAGSLDERFAEQTAMARLLSRFFGALGTFAMIVAAVGVFGTIRQQSLARRRELGIRMAIGASRPAILSTVTRSLALPSAVGLAAGLVLTWWGAPLLERYLFATSAFEPAVWLASFAALCGAVAAAGLLPALTVLRWNVAEIVREE